VALVRCARALAVAVAIAATAAVIAGCGSSAAPPPESFASCLPSGLTVQGGQIEVLSVQGAPCAAAEQVTTSVIAGLDAGKSVNGTPGLVGGWNCVTYGGNQATCTRARATLYAQFVQRRAKRRHEHRR
jgi:hypothetical protein